MLWGKLNRVLASWDDSEVGHSQRGLNTKPPIPEKNILRDRLREFSRW